MRRRTLILIVVIICLAIGIFTIINGTVEKRSNDVDLSMHGRFYSIGESEWAASCNISVSGVYEPGSDCFSGHITINSDNINLDEETVSLTFFNNIAVPKAKNKLGYQYTSRIHSVIRDGDNSNFVIILYNEYEVKDDQLSGRLDLEHPMFICVGDLTKDGAIDIIYNSYHHSTN